MRHLTQMSKSDLRHWALLLSAGFASFAMLYGGIISVFFAPLPLFLITLSKGARAGLYSALIATAFFTLTLSLQNGLSFVVLIGGPVVYMGYKALLSRTDDNDERHFYPLGLLASTMTMVAFAIFGIAYVFMLGEVPGGIEGALASLTTNPEFQKFNNALTLQSSHGSLMTADQRILLLQAILSLAPGMLLISWCIMMVINSAIAQGLLARFGKNLRPSPAFHKPVNLPVWCIRTFLGALVISLFLDFGFGFIFKNVFLISIVPFLIKGIAIVHGFIRKKVDTDNKRLAFLFFFYIMVLFLTWILVATTLYAVGDEIIKKYILRYKD